MEHWEAIGKLARASGGVFRTSDLTKLGYNTYAIHKLVNENVMERIKPGHYRLYKASEELSEAAQIVQ